MVAHLVLGMIEGPAGDEVKYIYVFASVEQAEAFQRMAHPNVTKSDVIGWEIIPTVIYTSATEAMKLHQFEILDEEENDNDYE